MRQIFLDTETTGMRVEDGNRIIEIGCIEMIARRFTGNHFHYYINPEREVEQGAFAVHGISNDFLKDKPLFSAILSPFIDFIKNAEIIIHNAPFDVAYIDNEFRLAGAQHKSIHDIAKITDTLAMARKIHVGQRNSLDALCKRYSIDNSKRDLHGALMDADLLGRVYLAMTGGQSSMFDESESYNQTTTEVSKTEKVEKISKHTLIVKEATAEEVNEHNNYLTKLKQNGKCLWIDD